jgi:hypothetical protein
MNRKLKLIGETCKGIDPMGNLCKRLEKGITAWIAILKFKKDHANYPL